MLGTTGQSCAKHYYKSVLTTYEVGPILIPIS